MQLLSPLTPPFSSATAPAQDAPRSLDGEQHASPHNRPRRDTTGATAAVPAPSSTNDADVPLFFMHKLSGAKTGPDSEAFMQGYNAHLRVEVPGYFAGMSGLALMRLGVDQQLRPEQLGALQRLMELRLIESARQNVGEFTKVLSAPGVKLTPMPQSLYLSILNPTSIGECQGITHVLSLAVKEGKQDTFFSNLFWALADPDAHESQAFFEHINKIQNAPSAQNLGAHDPATLRVAPYTTIAPELINSPTTKTLLITNMGDGKVKHRLSAGVMVAPDGGRTYYYHDANGAFAQFASKELFQEGLKKIYTSPELKSWYLPFEAGGYFTADKYQMSVFNPNVLPDFPPDSNAVKIPLQRATQRAGYR